MLTPHNCVDFLEEALKWHGMPDIFNSDLPHQSLGDGTPDECAQAGKAGG